LFLEKSTKWNEIFNFVGIKQIRDLKVAKEEQDIGFYAGFVGEKCFFCS
jgi:hypothetical protein